MSEENCFINVVNGIFISTNNGTTWSPFDSDLPLSNVYLDCIAVSGTNLFASTSDGRIWRHPL